MATAYGTVAEADQYFTDRGGAAEYPEWFASTELEKGLSMVRGSDFIDLEFEESMQGRRAAEGQTNAYPRTGVTVQGYLLSSTETPLRAKQASWEAAYRDRKGDELLPDGLDRSAGGEIESTSKGLGPLKTQVSYREGTQTNERHYRRIEALMRPLLIGGTSGVPVRVQL